MTKPSVNKYPLNLDQYQTYEIAQEYTAYTIKLNDLDEDSIENYEYEYIAQGYKIFHSALERSNQGKFNLTLIVAKLEILY